MCNRPDWKFAEGFRRHSHVGFSAEDRDLLSEILGDAALPRTVIGGDLASPGP